MLIKKLISTTILAISMLSLGYSENSHDIKIGYSDTLDTTKEASNLICYGFEADHPNNHCTPEFIDSEFMWNALINNEVQVALISEEVLLANRKSAKQPIIVMPLYQQYMILVGSNDLSLDSIRSFQDRTIGVTDWASKEYRAKPLSAALGLKEQDLYFPISKTRELLASQFCTFALDGVMIMSHPSSPLARELTTSCDGKVLSFSDEQIQKILKSSLGLYEATIPKEMYWRVDEDIKTFKSRIFLVITPNDDVAESFLNSLNHILDEINLVTLRTNITPESILETYDMNPVQIHSKGQELIDQLREDSEAAKLQNHLFSTEPIAQSSEESSIENLFLLH